MPWRDGVIDALWDALVVVDRSLVVLAWNRAMERVTGRLRADALGRPATDALPLIAAPPLADAVRRALEGEGEAACTVEIPFERAGAADGGRTGWVEARCAPWRDAGDRVRGVSIVLSDVTERRRQVVVVRALEAIGHSLTSSLNLDEVLDTVVERALDVMVAEAALVVSWDGVASRFGILRAAGRLSHEYIAAGSIAASGGPIGRAVREARSVATPNILTDPLTWLPDKRRRQIEIEGYKAVAAAPLAAKGRVHGALVVHYWTERDFADGEMAALARLAEQAAIAIDNARLYAEATRHAERLRELADVERLVTGSLDLDDVLRRIAEATARLLGAPVAHVWTADAAGRALRRRGSSVEASIPAGAIPSDLSSEDGVAARVAAEKLPLAIADVRTDPLGASMAWAAAIGLPKMLAVPVLTSEDVLGVLTVHGRSDWLLGEEDQALVVSLGARAALAIGNARAYAEAVARAARLGDLVAVTQSISASLDTTDVMQGIADAAAALSPGALAIVHRYDAERGLLRHIAVGGGEARELPPELPTGVGLPGMVFEQRLPVLVGSPVTHPRTLAREWWQARPGATFYGVPIVAGESLLGVLAFILAERAPAREEQEMLQLLAAHAGVAIRNATRYEGERVRTERIRALAEVNRRISAALDLDELLRTIAESAANLTGVRFAAFWLADDRRRVLALSRGSDPAMAADFSEQALSYDRGGVGWAARHRTPLVIDDVFADRRVVDLEWLGRWGLRTLAAYPVLAGDELLAILALNHSAPIRVDAETRGMIDLFIAQAAVAIQNARLYREAERRRDGAEALARLGRELAASLDVDRIAEVVTRGTVGLLCARGAAVYRYEPAGGTLHVTSAFGADAEAARGLVLGPGEGVAGLAVAERRLVTTPDLLHDSTLRLSRDLRARVEQTAYRAAAAVPLLARDRVIGALGLGAELGRELSVDELQAFQAFADQAALALENARLYASARDSLARLRETQAQLVQAAKMSALGQLVSGVAHELNNPLSVVIGYGQLLLGRDIPPALRRPIELMVSQGDRMAKIVRNLLFFARQRPPERAAVGLEGVIDETLALRQSQLALSGIVVAKDFARDLPAIAGDAQQLQQVFLNLILNAEQAIGEARRGGQIVLRTRATPDGASVRAEVVDDGPGIPPEALPRVFEPFFTTKEVGSGTGLGLSVSYGIVQEHGGRLTVESGPGTTTFAVELPVARGAASASPSQRGGSPAPLTVAGRAALVVEDEPTVLDLVVGLLEGTGWRVDIACGGAGGLERVRARRYDLIVSDIRMPDGDGEDFYRRATTDDPSLRRRFVFITGDTANPEVWRFLHAAKVPVIEKPFTPDAFLGAVRRITLSLTASASSA